MILFQLKAFWNRKVLTWHRKVISVGARRISVGRAFHSLGAAAEKALCLQAIPLTLIDGSFKRAPWLDLNCQVGSYGRRQSFRCPGPKSFRALYVKTSTLNWARAATGNQCNLNRIGLMCSLEAPPLTSRAARFWISCSCWTVFKGSPT